LRRKEVEPILPLTGRTHGDENVVTALDKPAAKVDEVALAATVNPRR
jgi:hypothetical protein